MTAQPSYLRYLEAAKQAETAEQLQAQGFTVESEVEIGGTKFDLVARKGAQELAFEFKAGKSSKTSKQSLQKLQQVAVEQGWEFRIVVVVPPPRVHVEVDVLKQHLFDHLLNHTPDALDQLSTHTRVDGLSDLEISDLRVKGDEMKIRGTGSIDVELNYGSGLDQDSGQGAGLYDSYPFSFAATLEVAGELVSVDELRVDTSSFYE